MYFESGKNAVISARAPNVKVMGQNKIQARSTNFLLIYYGNFWIAPRVHMSGSKFYVINIESIPIR
jgi:hypothetical protein